MLGKLNSLHRRARTFQLTMKELHKGVTSVETNLSIESVSSKMAQLQSSDLNLSFSQGLGSV